MTGVIVYPTEEKIIEYNLLVLRLIRVKKADQPKILSYRKITDALEETRGTKGDVYDKIVEWMKHGQIKEFRR